MEGIDYHFLMVDNYQRMDRTSLQDKKMTPPPRSPPDKQGYNQVNNIPLIDEYKVENFEDEVDMHNQSFEEMEDDEETSEALIKAFSPQNDQDIEEDVHQVTQNQGLSPRRLQHENFHFKNKDVKTVTAGRKNTTLFPSRSSQ